MLYNNTIRDTTSIKSNYKIATRISTKGFNTLENWKGRGWESFPYQIQTNPISFKVIMPNSMLLDRISIEVY